MFFPFCIKNNKPKTMIGIAKEEIEIVFPHRFAISQAQDVVQIFEPREIAIPWASGIKSALKNEIAIIVTRELLCITIAQTAHKVILFQILFVNFFKTFSNQPPVNSLNHCPKKIIQNKNKAIHPDIIQKFLLW